MRRVSIRELSADVIRNCANDSEGLGVTSKGALVGVLIPLTHDVLQRLATNDADELTASAAEVRAGAGGPPTNLRDVLQDPAPPTGRADDFSRVSIREISGALLERASSTGKPLVVTIDRIDVAVFLPLLSSWVDRLVTESVGRFLSDPVTDNSGPAAHVDTNTEVPAQLTRVSGRRFAGQRAIGIRIVGDARGDRERLVGVVTDGLARIKVDPITLPLERLDETYVVEQILSLIDMLRSHIDDTDDLIGVGIEIGGHVSQGRVVHSTNIHWDQFPVADQLSEIIGLPVVLENDANALAIHERYFEGISADNFSVVLVTHLGIGCGLVLDGRLHRGSRGMAAELGHVPIANVPLPSSHASRHTQAPSQGSIFQPSGSIEDTESEVRRCRCGNLDCLECIATPQGIEATLHANGFTGSFEDALKASQDPLVRDVIARAGTALGNGIAILLNLVNPEAIVLYGPLEVVGAPRQFHVENFNTVADAKAVTGAGRIYTDAMVDSIRNHVFSNAADACQFIVRIRSDEKGAKAAAACVIRAIRDRSDVGRQSRVPMQFEYSR
ncbi:MAG TPA: ROK family protein [Micromonosporaceae bacterium]